MIAKDEILTENSKVLFSSYEGVERDTIPKFSWPGKKCTELDSSLGLELCNSKGSSRVWQSTLIEYAPFVLAIIGVMKEMESLIRYYS